MYHRDFTECISNEQKRFAQLLEDHYIKTSYEFPLGYKSYDIYIANKNCFVEINPTYTHNSTNPTIIKDKVFSKPKARLYHYNKTKVALAHGYYCLHKFDWVLDIDMITLIKEIHKYHHQQDKDPRLHYYNVFTKEHIIDYNEKLSETDMADRGFVKIYDDGSILSYKH